MANKSASKTEDKADVFAEFKPEVIQKQVTAESGNSKIVTVVNKNRKLCIWCDESVARKRHRLVKHINNCDKYKGGSKSVESLKFWSLVIHVLRYRMLYTHCISYNRRMYEL